MKSERRHELQHNALLDWLSENLKAIKPHLNAILLAIVVVLLCVLGYTWMSRQSADKEAIAWDSVFVALGENNAAQLDQTVEQYPSTSAAQWAAVVSGDLHLAAGCEDLFTTKATAVDELQKAEASYKRVLDSSREAVIRERATYGQARTYEAMAATWTYEKMKSLPEWKRAIEKADETQLRPEIEEARREKVAEYCGLASGAYKEIVNNWPDGAHADAAQARIDALSRQSTQDFYDSLAAWEPRPAFTSPEGLDNLNLPFDESGKGLDVGAEPKSFFGDITDRVDDSMEGGEEGESTDTAEEGTDDAGADVPSIPSATSDEPVADEGTE